MNAKRRFVFLLTIILIFTALCVPVDAQGDPEFRYEVTVDGEDVVELDVGDVITVTLYLIRTDNDEPYTMYAMQSELRYDSSFFELIEDSVHLYDGVRSNDIAREGDYREFYMNFLSMSGGEEWQARTRVGSFQLRVIGTQGVTTITNEDYHVSTPGHGEGYKSESNTLTAILDPECLVRFETNGGTPVESQSVVFRDKVIRPQDPEREGMRFVGWYTDIFLTDPWNFDTDIVERNMRLYAKWEPIETEPPETEPPETETETETDPPETEPPETETETETEPPVTEPPETETDPPETEPPVTETETETETDPPETETETDPSETETESDIEIETKPPEEGSETETKPTDKPGKPTQPTKHCIFCGNAASNYLCARCAIVTWAGLCVLSLVLFAIIMYFYFRARPKNKKQ